MSPLALPPVALYVHLPWCERKCPYCDFNSYQRRGRIDEGRYLDALAQDLEASAGWLAGRGIASVFIGGGTPSLFSPAAIARLLEDAARKMSFAEDVEITLEANPGSAERGRFEGYRAAGVNRLSIGVQSFRDGMLRALGRIHSAADAEAAVRTALAAGFDNLNVDLMFGLPDDDPSGARGDLERAIAVGVPHVSWYQLTLEPGTAFAARPPSLPADEDLIATECAGSALLTASGFERYEISAWAREGRRAAHNLNYWRFGDYLGIGAGAHGKITLPERDAILRTTRPRHPETYMKHASRYAAADCHEITDPRERATEYLMNVLRLTEGSPPAEAAARTGLPASLLLRCAEDLAVRRPGWLAVTPSRLAATAAGRRHLDTLLVELSAAIDRLEPAELAAA